jgi:hypothetical protein
VTGIPPRFWDEATTRFWEDLGRFLGGFTDDFRRNLGGF